MWRKKPQNIIKVFHKLLSLFIFLEALIITSSAWHNGLINSHILDVFNFLNSIIISPILISDLYKKKFLLNSGKQNDRKKSMNSV